MRLACRICLLRIIFLGSLCLALTGCTYTDYYYQAALGQFRLIAAQEPIEQLIQNGPSALQSQLLEVQKILDFAEGHMELPLGGKYQTYVKLERDYVLWNVVGAEEFSVEARHWCFPIAGCVTYRGYFLEADALAYINRIQAENLDLYLGGISAYSTLGWFNDPLLSTYIDWPLSSLALLLIHELAHSKIYLPGDTRFSEAFASFVGQEGQRQFLKLNGADVGEVQYWSMRREQNALFNNYLLSGREALVKLYDQPIPEFSKRILKQQLMAEIKNCYTRNKAQLGAGRFDSFFQQVVNNARLVSVSSYNDLVGAFGELYRRAGSWSEFYRLSSGLAQMSESKRSLVLAALIKQSPVITGMQELTKEEVAYRGNDGNTHKIQCDTFTYHYFYGNFPGAENDSIGGRSNG